MITLIIKGYSIMTHLSKIFWVANNWIKMLQLFCHHIKSEYHNSFYLYLILINRSYFKLSPEVHFNRMFLFSWDVTEGHSVFFRTLCWRHVTESLVQLPYYYITGNAYRLFVSLGNTACNDARNAKNWPLGSKEIYSLRWKRMRYKQIVSLCSIPRPSHYRVSSERCPSGNIIKTGDMTWRDHVTRRTSSSS